MGKPYSLWSSAFWRAYWITLRPYLFFLSGVSGVVGLALVRDIQWSTFCTAFAAFFFSYGLGQALTDVFQIDTDALSSPYRPLTQGVITRKQVLTVSLLGLGVCCLVLVVVNPWTLPFALLGVLGLATYTPLKRRWWGGPFWNAWVVALLPLLGVLCGGGSPAQLLEDAALRWLIVSVFFSYAVFVLLGYHKDISADRRTGYHTIPVRFGWHVSVAASAGLALVAVCASALALGEAGVFARFPAADAVSSVVLVVVGASCLLRAHVVMLDIRWEHDAHLAIAWVVRGYVLAHVGEAVAFQPLLALPGLVLCGLFELVLWHRPERSQI